MDRARLKWNGWGLAGKHFDMHGRDKLYPYIHKLMGTKELPSTPSVTLEALSLPASRLSATQRADLEKILGATQVRDSRFERVFHSAGRSTHDLLRLRTGRLAHYVDVAVYPRSSKEVRELLAWAQREKAALVPFGGGSSVVGGVEALGRQGQKLVVSLDTTEMAALLSLDEESGRATIQAGVYGPALEEMLSKRGWRLGHFPQSFEFSTLGGWVAARSSGQQSGAYGAIAEMVIGLKVETPAGTVEVTPIPNNATGPSLREILVGSEGVFGLITEVTVRLHRLPPARDYRGLLFKNFVDAQHFIREAVQSGVPCAMLRLSDENETEAFSKMAHVKPAGVKEFLAKRYLSWKGYGPKPCLMLVGFECTEDEAAPHWKVLRKIASGRHGFWLGQGPGESWYATRFEAPYLRDRLFDEGVAIDTLETATTWDNIAKLKQATTEGIERVWAQQKVKGLLLCHISHAYATGASLYFSLVYQMNTYDPLTQWREIKEGASNAINRAGGTISHHHGVGVDHKVWAEKEWGSVGLKMLGALKHSVDPEGLMNPGKFGSEP